MKVKVNINLQEAIDIFRRQKIREVFFYACFLLLFTTSTYLQRDVHDAYNYVDTVRNVIMKRRGRYESRPFPVDPFFKTFENVSTQSDFWSYMNYVVPQFLFQETWYNHANYSNEQKQTGTVDSIQHLFDAYDC
eukprot:765127-Hanusia_phi.AAC.4